MFDFIRKCWFKPAEEKPVGFLRGSKLLFTTEDTLDNISEEYYQENVNYKGLVVYASVKTETVECRECGELFVKNSVSQDNIDNNGDYICDDCRCNADDIYYCDRCEEWHRDYYDKRVNTRYGTETWCEWCVDRYAFYCEDCDEYYSQSYFSSYDVDNGDRTVCENCIEDYYRCDECGEYYSDLEEGDDGFYYCPDCIGNHKDRTIHDYGYKPKPEFKGEGDEYFGLELEVAGDTSYAKEFYDIMNEYEDEMCYLKHDGSVDGFEIVSQPMTREFVYDVYKNRLDKGLKFLRSNDFRGHNQGGIHIHVSKDVITNRQLNKLVSLLYPKQENNYKLWLGITQRHREKMEQWSSMELENKREQQKYIQSVYNEEYKPKIDNRRYTAINVTEHTIEFRIFNSNTRLERVMKNYEVIFSLLDFTKTDKLPTMRNYINYIVDNDDKYKYLYDFLIEKKLAFTKEQKQKEQDIIKMFDSVFPNDIRTIKDIITELVNISTNPRIAEQNIDLEVEV